MPPVRRASLFGPMAFAFCMSVFAAGAGYVWWLDHRGRAPAPLREVRAATLPALEPAPVPARPAARDSVEPPPPPAARVVRKCLGTDGVPVFTGSSCPRGTTLVSETPVEVASHAPAMAPATAAAPAVVVANASATVVNQAPGYGIPDRRYRQDAARERAWDRCERAKVRAETELAALRHQRKMSDIRRWENYAEDECAAYEIMTR